MQLPSKKLLTSGQIRAGLWACVILLILTLWYDFPKQYNRLSEIVKEKTSFSLGAVGFPPFRLGLDLKGGAHLVYEVDTTAVAAGDVKSAVEGGRDVIERRVNALGVAEAVVQTNQVGDKWRVIVELPDVQNVGEAIKMIGETPILEFKEPYPEGGPKLTPEEQKQMDDFNVAAKKRVSEIGRTVTVKTFADVAKQKSEDPLTRENGGTLGFVNASSTEFSALYIFAKKYRTGEISRTPIEASGGFDIVKVGEKKPNGEIEISRVLIKKKQITDIVKDLQWKSTGLSGKQLVRANVQFEPTLGTAQVGLEFDNEGRDLFAAITKRNLQKPVAIFLDGQPISIPVVQSEITDGKAVISGNFTLENAKQLSQRLNAGALPLPVSLVSQQTVGPTLGLESLKRSLFAGLIGFILVAAFMILYYRLPGFLAVTALILYTSVALAIFKFVPVTLTLAGIAGFILSIGMAVDANVLVFERTKEELRRGKSLRTSIEEAFPRAWASIRDSNVSSLITCIILAWYGTSIVKGFAITLAIGILISMFSAITVTRVLLRFVMPKLKEDTKLVLR